MTHGTGSTLRFSNRRRHKVEADFQGWCERHGVKYLTGIGLDPHITGQSRALPDEARGRHERSRGKQRLFGGLRIRRVPGAVHAGSW